MLHDEARLRKLEGVVRVPHSSTTVLLSCSPESPLRAQIFEERKKVAAFVKRERAHTVNQPELHLATANKGFYAQKSLHKLSLHFRCEFVGALENQSYEHQLFLLAQSKMQKK